MAARLVNSVERWDGSMTRKREYVAKSPIASTVEYVVVHW
jgi:hypothetical protein